MHNAVLLLHIISATIWTGGHLVLALTILPRALQQRSISELQQFESGYERIGIPALITQVLSGLWLAYDFLPDVHLWFSLDGGMSHLILWKLLLLATTVLFALDARLRVIPNLSPQTLPSLARHVIPVTVISVLFVVCGVEFRTGWLA